MTVSVLFLAYNHTAFVRQALRSVFAQDYPAFELVVCEDASKDDTRKAIEEELAQCPPHIAIVRAYSDKNSGVKACFNRCFSKSTGDICVHASGDDISLPNRISRIVETFKAHPGCALVYSDCTLIGPNDEMLRESALGPGKAGVYRHETGDGGVFAGSSLPGASAAYRADIHRAFGPLIPGHHAEDIGYFARALMLGEIHCLPDRLVLWRAHANNINNNLSKLEAAKAAPPPSMTELQNRWIGHARMLNSFHRQWAKDFTTALREEKNPHRRELLASVFHKAQTESVNRRLLKYSLKRSRWGLWLRAAGRLFKLRLPRPCVNTLAHALKIRISGRHRDAYLRLHAS